MQESLQRVTMLPTARLVYRIVLPLAMARAVHGLAASRARHQLAPLVAALRASRVHGSGGQAGARGSPKVIGPTLPTCTVTLSWLHSSGLHSSGAAPSSVHRLRMQLQTRHSPHRPGGPTWHRTAPAPRGAGPHAAVQLGPHKVQDAIRVSGRNAPVVRVHVRDARNELARLGILHANAGGLHRGPHSGKAAAE
jgi:hypothetical protein